MRRAYHFGTVGSLLFCLITSEVAMAQMRCSNLFAEASSTVASPLSQLLAHQEEYALNSKREDLSYANREAEKKKINAKISETLIAAGIKTKFEDYNFTGFIILPEGSTYIAKVARGLAKRGIRIQYSPMAVGGGALGMYHGGHKMLYFDAASILGKTLSPVGLHEIRHAMDDYWSNQKPGNFERIYQSSISNNGNLGVAPTLPGAHKEFPYKEYFSLDEILAHRQSLASFLSNFRRQAVTGAELTSTLKHIRSHSANFLEFARVWQITGKIFESEIAQDSFTVVQPESPETLPEFQTVSVNVAKPTWLQSKFFRKSPQDPSVLDLNLKLMFSKDEADRIRKDPKVQGKRLLIERLQTIDSAIKKVELRAMQIEAAMLEFDGKDDSRIRSGLDALAVELSTQRDEFNQK